MYRLIVPETPFINFSICINFQNLLAILVHVFMHARLREMQIGIISKCRPITA